MWNAQHNFANTKKTKIEGISEAGAEASTSLITERNFPLVVLGKYVQGLVNSL